MHKKFFAVVLAFVFACLAGCQATTTGNTTQEDINTKFTGANLTPISFKAQYIRTNGSKEEVKYPVTTVIKSVQKLHDYYEANKDYYDLEGKSALHSTISFSDAVKKYDDAYFESKVLVLFLLEETSGSIRHKVTNVNKQAHMQIQVQIDKITPNGLTDDMAEWHILVELKKDEYNDLPVNLGLMKPMTLKKVLPFKAQYIRTDGYHAGVKYPITTVIKTRQELDDYYKANKDKYQMEWRKSPPASDSSIGFLNAVEKYDEAFFNDHLLVLVLLEEPSGSNRHKVTGVNQGKDETEVDILRLIPSVGTADMAEWHILIELNKADYNGTPFKVKLDKQIEEMTTY